MELIYRFIFVLMETAQKMYSAQSSRCGYASIKTSYFSLGLLIANLFNISYNHSQRLFNALLSRCYMGGIRVLEPEYVISRRNIAVILVVESILVALSFV